MGNYSNLYCSKLWVYRNCQNPCPFDKQSQCSWQWLGFIIVRKNRYITKYISIINTIRIIGFTWIISDSKSACVSIHDSINKNNIFFQSHHQRSRFGDCPWIWPQLGIRAWSRRSWMQPICKSWWILFDVYLFCLRIRCEQQKVFSM